MCGIVGLYSMHAGPEDMAMLRRAMVESSIRGRHASGVAWYTEGHVETIVEPIPIDTLVEGYWDRVSPIDSSGMVAIIAHARYSTSDIRYNQPIQVGSTTIVHNGVITQMPPELWEGRFGYRCTTRNDSELLAHLVDQHGVGAIPEVFPDSSIAALVLDTSGHITPYRNGLRPLWASSTPNGVLYTSTRDIALRAGAIDPHMVETSDNGKDLQVRHV